MPGGAGFDTIDSQTDCVQIYLPTNTYYRHSAAVLLFQENLACTDYESIWTCSAPGVVIATAGMQADSRTLHKTLSAQALQYQFAHRKPINVSFCCYPDAFSCGQCTIICKLPDYMLLSSLSMSVFIASTWYITARACSSRDSASQLDIPCAGGRGSSNAEQHAVLQKVLPLLHRQPVLRTGP